MDCDAADKPNTLESDGTEEDEEEAEKKALR